MLDEFIISLPSGDQSGITEILKENNIHFEVLESRNFDGLSDIAQVLIALTTVSVPVVGKILVEAIKAKSKISIKYKNIELTGLDREEAEKLIKKLSDR